MVKPSDAALNTILASRQFFTADLITITLQNGTTLNYCSGQTNIVFAGSTFNAGGVGSTQGGPYWDRKDNKSKVVQKIGTQVDQLTIDVIPGAAMVSTFTFWNAVRLGLFDNADFQLRRLFMPSSSFGTVVSTACGVLIFEGSVGVVNADRAIVTFQIDDYRQLLNQQMPKWLFAANCQNTLYDANCTVVSSNFASSGVIATSSFISFTYSTTVVGISTNASGYFDNGKIVFTSGQNNTLGFTVSSYSTASKTFTLTSPLPYAAAAADTFTAYPGCDRSTGAGGCTKFGNLPNFRGMPYIPDPGTPF